MTAALSCAKLVLPLDEWPEVDQQLWRAGLLPGDILDGAAYASDLRPTTLRNSARGYGRWLAVLDRFDSPALLLDPVERVTPARIRLFLQTLQGRGNTNNSVKARLWEVRSALRVMRPERDFSWLTKPGGRSLAALLPTTLKGGHIIDSRELARWGEDLMMEGLKEGASHRTELFRNGLLVAILACRAPRQRSLASLRLGHSILQDGECYRLAFGAEDTKNGKPLEYSLPATLTPSIDHYLAVERPRLLGGQAHDWFWVNRNGDRLAEIGIQGIIWRGSKARFGFAFLAHRFRHSLATTSQVLNPTTPAAIAAVLGNSPFMVERHYALARQVEAARRWHDTLETYFDAVSIDPPYLGFGRCRNKPAS